MIKNLTWGILENSWVCLTTGEPMWGFTSCYLEDLGGSQSCREWLYNYKTMSEPAVLFLASPLLIGEIYSWKPLEQDEYEPLRKAK